VTFPLIPAAFAASIVTCFAPEQNCALLALGAIEAAQHEILVNAYGFTLGSGIPGALVRAHARGVDVAVIADKWTPCERQEGLSAVAAAGIPVWIDTRVRIAHEKALIIDSRVTIEGSYNFSAGAAWNSEDLNVVTSPEVAEAYATHWQAQRAVSVRFGAASDWCER
jgi:phosphatidylserine/phosphatidylglycerophosphate/cardiolipin synthase-like enzyme